MQARAQLVVVLDDAVVHHGHRVLPIDVRVCVLYTRPPVRRPAGMRDTHGAGETRAGIQRLAEARDLAGHAQALNADTV